MARDGWNNDDYRSGDDAGYRGSGFLGGDWPGGRRIPGPYRGQSGPMSAPGDRDLRPPSFRGRGPRNYRRSDARIREDVCDRLTLDHDVDATDIEVAVEGTVVTLSGTVSDRETKRRAELIAESVRGVSDVQNNLRLGSNSQQ